MRIKDILKNFGPIPPGSVLIFVNGNEIVS